MWWKWFLRASVVANVLLAISCTNGVYDPQKGDRIATNVGEYTGITPTTKPLPLAVSATVESIPYGNQILGLVNAGLLIYHEVNARKRSGKKVTNNS